MGHAPPLAGHQVGGNDADEFTQIFHHALLDAADGHRGHAAAGAGADHVDVDGVAVHFHQLAIAAVHFQVGPYRFDHGLDASDALQGSHAAARPAGGEWQGFRLVDLGSGLRIEGDALFGQHPGQHFFDAFVASRAAAARLGVVGHVLDRAQAVGADGVLDHDRIDGEAFTDQGALLVVVFPLHPAVIGHGGLQRLAPHHRTVHLLRREAVQVVGDVLIGDLQRVLDRHALDDFGQRRGRGDRGAAAESLEGSVLDEFIHGVDLDRQPQGIPAVDRADIADAVGPLQHPDIAGVVEVFLDFFGVVPHGVYLLRSGRERIAAGAGALGVGIDELEAGTFQAFDEVDGGAADHRQAGGIDEDLHLVALDDGVVRAGGGFQLHAVLKSGTAAAADLNSETLGAAAGALDETVYGLNRFLSQCHHGLPPENGENKSPCLPNSKAHATLEVVRMILIHNDSLPVGRSVWERHSNKASGLVRFATRGFTSSADTPKRGRGGASPQGIAGRAATCRRPRA